MTTQQAWNEFVLLWAVVDPVGTVPVFLAVATGLSAVDQRRLALRAVMIATGVMLFFAVAGEALLAAMSIPLPSFQVAGGIVLLAFSMTMILGPSKPAAELEEVSGATSAAVYPLAIPSIASPGAILATVMMTDSHRNSLPEQAVSVMLLLVVLALTLLLLLFAQRVDRLLGKTGAEVISRTMGLLLAAIAVDNIMQGIRTFFFTAG